MAARKKTAQKATTPPSRTIAFQGQPGAYSHLACREYFPAMSALPTAAFEDTFAAVTGGRAKLAMIPIENSVAGRVADIHRIMPDSGLHIVGERFLRVNHHLLAPPGATLKSIRRVHSHVHALGQCGLFLRKHGLEAVVHADTAGAAADIAASGDVTEAAIASELAGEVYGPLVTSFVFQVRNVPAALYKAMGGFATNGVNMTKLESYMVGGDFVATQFYADVEGDPRDTALKLALEELDFFTHKVTILGTYPADPFRFGK